MNPEQQRIALAEACGWEYVYNDPERYPYWLAPKGDCRYGNLLDANLFPKAFPNYLNDLNAMRDAEQQLWEMDWSFRTIFNDHLANIIKRRKVNRNEWDAETLLDATAAQRAEAFLRTIGKWTETNSIKEPAYL